MLRVRCAATAIALLSAGAWPQASRSQDRSARPQPQRQPSNPTKSVLPETNESSADPIGTGGIQSLTIGAHSSDSAPSGSSAGPDSRRRPASRLARAVPVRDAPASDIPIRHGSALQAIAPVRETAHDIVVRLEHGLAHITATLTFESRTERPAEILYRLPVPEPASLASLRVCANNICRDVQTQSEPAYERALSERSSKAVASPFGFAAVVRPEHHHAGGRSQSKRAPVVRIRAAPVSRARTLKLTARYVVPAPVHGGIVRVGILPRGMDPRAAQATVRVVAPTLLASAADGELLDDRPISLDPWEGTEITARLPTGAPRRAAAERFRCGSQTCARAWVAAPPRRLKPAHIILLLDVSPSMEGPARHRAQAAAAGLLAIAPKGSTVQALTFAAAAKPIASEPTPPDHIRLDALAKRSESLGSATRFEAAWNLASPWARRRASQLVWIGDGGFTQSHASRIAFAEAREAQIPVHIVNVSDRKTTPALRDRAARSGGVVIDAPNEAERAHRDSGGPLAERLSLLFSPVVARSVHVSSRGRRIDLGALRAGEQKEWRGANTGRVSLSVARRSYHARMRTGERAVDLSAHDSTARSLAKAQAPYGAGQGVPKETVRSMLHHRIVPAARDCFRRDRAGRSDYQVRAEYRLRMADREVSRVEVHGDLKPPLRQCLLRAVDGLHVPRFAGQIDVTYPLRTEAHPPPPRIELVPGIARAVDEVFGDEPNVPSRASTQNADAPPKSEMPRPQ